MSKHILRTSALLALSSFALSAACSGGDELPGGTTGTTGNQGTTTGNVGSGGGAGMDTSTDLDTASDGDGTTTGGNTTGGNSGGNSGILGNSGGGSTVGSGGNFDVGSGGSTMGDGTDQNGKTDAKLGDSSSANQDYLKMGDIRILNNNWGSEDLGCSNSAFSVFVEQSGAFGWTFDRGACGGEGSKPDFPQVEFGVHPFGIVDGQGWNHLATSPNFSSTTLMPIQMKDITSASVSVENLNVMLESANKWNITFEFWVSKKNPLTDPDPEVYAELMTFWGWEGGRWPSAPGEDGSQEGGSGTGDQVASAGKNYTLWVQRDQWADGWRYFQFRDDTGPNQNFNGTLDVKPFIDYLLQNRQIPGDYWVTRLEVGSEIDDNTKGKVSMAGITFEVNGQSRSQMLAQ